MRAAVTWLGRLGAVAAAEAVLWWTRRPLPDPVHRTDLGGFAVAAVRDGGLVLGGIVLAAAVLTAVAQLLRAPRLAALVAKATLPSLRSVAVRGAGSGLAVSLLLGSPARAAETPPAPAPAAAPLPALRRLPDAPAPGSLRRLPDAPGPRQPPGEPARAPATTTAPAPPPAPPTTVAPAQTAAPDAPPPQAAAPAAAAPEAAVAPARTDAAPSGSIPRAAAPAGTSSVEVRPGDSFWRIAQREVAGRLGREPSEQEVGALWVELVALNRDRLPVPSDPDLLFPGAGVLLPGR